jgi:hypothetical protein
VLGNNLQSEGERARPGGGGGGGEDVAGDDEGGAEAVERQPVVELDHRVGVALHPRNGRSRTRAPKPWTTTVWWLRRRPWRLATRDVAMSPADLLK